MLNNKMEYVLFICMALLAVLGLGIVYAFIKALKDILNDKEKK